MWARTRWARWVEEDEASQAQQVEKEEKLIVVEVEKIVEKRARCFTCVQSLALTDTADVRTCQVLRGLQRGQCFEALGGSSASARRLRAKACKDGMEG